MKLPTRQPLSDTPRDDRHSPFKMSFTEPALHTPSTQHPYPLPPDLRNIPNLTIFDLSSFFIPKFPTKQTKSFSTLTTPPLLSHPTPISRRHIPPSLTLLLLLWPATRHTKYDEEQDGHRSRKADHDGFPMNAKVDKFVGVGRGRRGW